ncbi:DUF6286 domain-containing protein [Microlunatus ginsengisoli]|uniref:DUF6286 domain-containing protein n=1 Tax=Microlunatus ginsengisoli TaxID=363863 RepID=A0ABP7A428_9ACTN
MSRADGRSRALRRRPSRSIPALIVALALVAAGVVIGWPAVAVLATGTAPAWAQSAGGRLSGQPWADPWTVAAMVVVGLLGLVLVVVAVLPGRPNAYRLAPPFDGPAADGSSLRAKDTDFVISRRALARLATARADQVEGVEGVRASVDSSTVRIRIRTSWPGSRDVAGEVSDQVRRAYQAAGVDPLPRIIATTTD